MRGAWLAAQPGGVFSLPQWGKIWLALLGLYDRRGLNPCPPELFLLPHWLPGAPTRLYCHTRHIYLGLAYLLGSGFAADLGPIAAELRHELYGDSGGAVDPAHHRHELATSDAYVRPGAGLRFAYDAVRRLGALWRRMPGATALRRRALDSCYARILFEQDATRYQGLSPVNGVLNTLAIGVRAPAASIRNAASTASRAGAGTMRPTARATRARDRQPGTPASPCAALLAICAAAASRHARRCGRAIAAWPRCR